MFKIKKQFSSIIYICLISFIGLLFIINSNKVMAMDKNNSEIRNNKGEQIANNEPIVEVLNEDEEDFFQLFQLLIKTKEKIQKIIEKNPHLQQKFSVEEIEAANILLFIKNGFENSNQNEKK